MEKLIEILKKNGIEYKFYDEDGTVDKNCVELIDVGGQVYAYELGSYKGLGFVSGNEEYSIKENSPLLEEFIMKYNDGFDEFQDYLETLTEGKDYIAL